MRTAITSIISDPRIEAIYGFGSFFRGDSFDDIDILITTSISTEGLADLHRAICRDLDKIAIAAEVTLDFTLLTNEEFADAPLRDHFELVKLV